MAVVLVAFLVTWAPVYSRDWGWHLATVERMLLEGQLPWDDVFSYTAGKVYEPVHLVFQFTLYATVRVFGLVSGLGLYRTGLSAAIGLALFAVLRRRDVAPWAAFALCAVVLVGGENRLMVRPHLWTTLGLVLVFDILLEVRDGRLRRPVRLIPLFLVWTNAHPGVVYGVFVLAGFVVAEGAWIALRRSWAIPPERWGHLSLWCGVALLATFVHPLGPGLYPYLLGHRGMQTVLEVGELAPLFALPFNLAYGPGLAFWLGGAVFAVGRRRHLDPTLAGAAVAFFLLACVAGRELPQALAVLAIALSGPVASLGSQPVEGRRRLAFGLLLLPIALGVVRAAEGGYGLSRRNYPVAACDWILANHVQGPLYNTNAVGGYLVYRLAPRGEGEPGLRVYSDGRMPMFYEALELAREFAQVEARYAPQVLVVDFQHPLGRAHSCERSPGFADRYALVHVSAAAKVYLRRGGANQGLIEHYGYRQLLYVGKFWPGRRVGRLGGLLPPPGDPEAFRAEVERARREAPDLEVLPRF